MSRLIKLLKLKGSIPKAKATGIIIKDAPAGQFSRCQCGVCRCCVVK